ncbi:MAG: TIM barrel protein [Planctomycetes bacterium]|nr:TIM barrel protein [Planctomycetota bacterium]
MNFVPSTAANTTELWQAETFDEAAIERELGWASDLGFNACRVFVQHLVWRHDPGGLRRRVERFLAIASGQGLSTVLVLFDDCSFGDPPVTEPYLGRQRNPIPGMICPSWTPSPGLKAVTDRAAWPDLERYVLDMVSAFGGDERVVLWDLYNEPGNSGMGSKSLPLVEAAFAWAREADPVQPLTVGVWTGALEELNRRQLELSDIVSFHAYTDHDGMRKAIAAHGAHGRPVVCTEWMARHLGSRFGAELPLFRAEGVGCLSWGLVNGRTQCQFSWGSKRGAPEPEVWFHDILRRDGTPFDPGEVAAIRRWTGASPRVAAQLYVWTQHFGAKGQRLEDRLDEALAATRRAGYGAVQGWLDACATPEKARATLEALRKNGLVMRAAYTDGRLHEEDAAAKASEEILRKARIARDHGLELVVMNPDPIGREKTDQELAVQARSLEALGSRLRDLGLRLAVHSHDPEMRSGAREWRHVLRSTTARNVSFCLDLHWVLRGGQDPIALLEEAGPRVADLHLRNSRDGVWLEDLGPGDIDHGRVADALRKIGYGGTYTVELAHEPRTELTRPLEESLRRSLAFVRETLLPRDLGH